MPFIVNHMNKLIHRFNLSYSLHEIGFCYLIYLWIVYELLCPVEKKNCIPYVKHSRLMSTLFQTNTSVCIMSPCIFHYICCCMQKWPSIQFSQIFSYTIDTPCKGPAYYKEVVNSKRALFAAYAIGLKSITLDLS